MQDYIIANGQTLSNQAFAQGDTILVQAGGTLSDSVIPHDVVSVSLETGAILSGTIRTAKEFTLSGAVNASSADLILDISGRKPEETIMITDWTLLNANSLSVIVDPDQDKGTYRLAGNASTFSGTIAVTNPLGTSLGTLSLENLEFDFDITHYLLSLNDANELCLTVSANIIDIDENILYYKNGSLVKSSAKTGTGVTISINNDYDKIILLSGGCLTDSTVSAGGWLILESGGKAENIILTSKGEFDAEFRKDDGTVLSGTYGETEFSFSNNVGKDICITSNSQITAYEGITIDGALFNSSGGNGSGNLVIENGATLTGDIRGANALGTVYVYEGGMIKDSVITNNWIEANGATVENSDIITFDNSFRFCTIHNSTFHNRQHTTITGCTISDSIFSGTSVSLNDITLSGDITVDAERVGWEKVNANGHTINLDYTNRSTKDEALIKSSPIRNAEIVLTVKADQVIGTYALGTYSSQIGQGNSTRLYNEDTKTWDFKGSVIGDMDGIIEIRDENGILLANCTVNGDTEYFGRYNYTVRVDDSGIMYLDVGWNNRESRTYAADGLDNDTMATAAVLPASGTKYTIDSASDIDWFKFKLETTGRDSSYIGLEFKQWAGDLDLYLYDSAGNQLDYAKSVTDNERISLCGLAAGDYYIRVEGYEGNVNEYKLAYNLPAPLVLTDEYENGNDKAHSYHLGKLNEPVSIQAAISDSEDQDYYMFQLPKKGLTCDTITLTYEDEVGDLDLYLYGSNGLTLLVSSLNTEGGTEQISLNGLKHGVYYVAVKSKDGAIGNYKLDFNVNAQVVEPDKYENNNKLTKATKLYTPNGEGGIENLSIHDDADVDYFSFSLKEAGSADDWIGISYEVCLGDLDLEVLNSNGDVIAYSRTAENEDKVSLKGLAVGDYYIRVSGYNNVANNYTLNWTVTNSSLIPSDSYEGMEPIAIRENQTIGGLSIAKPVKDDETRADTFKITLDYTGGKRSKIILTDYRSDWENGMAYVLKDANDSILQSGTGSEISLAGLVAGDYYLTVDAPNEDEYSEYSLIAQDLPDSNDAKNNTWSVFIYMAGDNNLEGAYLDELLHMQKAVLPEKVDVYVLLDRSKGYAISERNWTDTRVGKIRHSSGRAVAVDWMYFDGVNTGTYVNTHNQSLEKDWDTGNVATLEAFLDWGMKVGPADNYALIMKDHGTSLGFNSTDEESGSIMSIKDIAELLKADKYEDLSVVAFDQCLMGSDVVVTTMEGTVDYVVASEAVGYTPNQLMMYKVLFNSLATDMTPRQLAQKMVKACNCSGYLNLTSASFHAADSTLSEALQAFGEASRDFTRQDWAAICKSFALAYNYGDDICAYSDLGFFLSTLKEYSASISGTLLEATGNLYSVVSDQLIDSTMITPAVYGSGLAIFNPVLSSDAMRFYSYAPGANMDYYGTVIGQTAWGKFLYNAGQLAEDCTEFFVDSRTNLTFTDFSYSIEDEEVKVTYNLGTFTGNGVKYHGLYMDRKACFTITLDQAGIEGDAIHVTTDNPDAKITVELIQTEYTLLGPVKTTRRTSTDGILSLYGIDPAKAGVDTEYDLIITSDRETTYDLSFVADWTSGSDFFDYSRSGRLGAQGNGSIEKATVLAAGNYGGLVTYAGDADYYKLNTVYTDTLNVTVNGSGLSVAEYDTDGQWIQTAEWTDGKYTLSVANGNYLRVEGGANLAEKRVDSYSLYISDVSNTYTAPSGDAFKMPEKPDVEGELKDNQVVVSINVEDGMKSCQSSDLQTWTECENNTFVATQNGEYYFKSVDAETGLESKYTSLRVVEIQERISDVAPQKQTWEKAAEDTTYIVELAADDGHSLQFIVDSNSLDSFQMPAGNYQMRVKPEGGEWTVLEPVVASEVNTEPKLVKSNADGSADVFFANPIGTWESGYVAQHVGSINDWTGTDEYAAVYGKNKLADIIEGSTDANILLMTDDENGDSLFVDDIYSALPGSVSEQQSRIAQIDEVRAGAGNDIVDMTSQQFEYIGDGLTIRGGEGNDVIWANKGDNFLFGDAGNDRIVGASGNDVIAGGIGNDRMHGGGGDDIFTFGENWGTDTVEQLATGSVTLWFASGSEANWNAETLTYTDGDNSVKVSGVTGEKITLKFGEDGFDQFAMLSSIGAFADFTSERIFEEEGKGITASLRISQNGPSGSC